MACECNVVTGGDQAKVIANAKQLVLACRLRPLREGADMRFLHMS